MTVLTLIVASGVLVVAVFAWATLSTRRTLRRIGFDPDQRPAQLPADRKPLPPMTCPACSSTGVEVVSSGLWDGHDLKTGAAVGGSNEYGLCRRCQTRVARYNDGACYTPTENEWNGWAL
jgi:hypothetical protein